MAKERPIADRAARGLAIGAWTLALAALPATPLVPAFAAVAPRASASAAARGTDEVGLLTRRARSRLEFEVPAEKKPDEVRWTGDWLAALAESARRNVPVLAILSDDQSAGFQTMSSAVYSKEGFGALSQKVVLVAAFDGKAHPAKERTVAGATVAWCELFRCSCDDHRASYLVVRDTFAQREYWNPLHVFVGADGIELARAEGHQLTLARLQEELAHATKERAGPWMGYGEYVALLKSVRALVDSREKRGGAHVHRELGKLLQAEQRGSKDAELPRPLKTAAMTAWIVELQAALIEEAEGLIEDALELARGGDRAGAKKRLAAIARGMKGLPIATSAQQELDRFGKDDAPDRVARSGASHGRQDER
ncbi:MAG: hypothetical protein JNL90_07370 [Planctomycetes bacterium]|nr:hypothetical protein [Planctomycetota bacterium]